MVQEQLGQLQARGRQEQLAHQQQQARTEAALQRLQLRLQQQEARLRGAGGRPATVDIFPGAAEGAAEGAGDVGGAEVGGAGRVEEGEGEGGGAGLRRRHPEGRQAVGAGAGNRLAAAAGVAAGAAAGPAAGVGVRVAGGAAAGVRPAARVLPDGRVVLAYLEGERPDEGGDPMGELARMAMMAGPGREAGGWEGRGGRRRPEQVPPMPPGGWSGAACARLAWPRHCPPAQGGFQGCRSLFSAPVAVLSGSGGGGGSRAWAVSEFD
jgi:hypothetical protein